MSEGSGKRKKILLIIGIAAVVLILIAGISIAKANKSKQSGDEDQNPSVSDEDTKKDEKEKEDDSDKDSSDNEEKDSDEKSEEKSSDNGNSIIQTPVVENISDIVIPGYTELTLSSKTKTPETELYNPDENKGLYDLSFSLRIKDTGEVLFTTDYVKGGEAITEVELSAYLVSGTYEAVLTVQPRRADGTLTNKAEINLLLIAD